MLPPPTLTIEIPSIEDDLVLQCRIYHPSCLAPTSLSQISPWRKRGAIVAHPYAPLGGSYDDPVVDVAASTILKQGFVVGTFNFRGAGSSKGRTSWQSKAEQNDYISFLGFMIYYLHHLCPPVLPDGFINFPAVESHMHDLSPVPSHTLPPPHLREPRRLFSDDPSSPTNVPDITVQDEVPHPHTRLLIAGYSYGGMIAVSLPGNISDMITPLQAPLPGSAHAEIRLRAECLALQQNDSIVTSVKWLVQKSQLQKRGRNQHPNDQLSSPKLRKTSGNGGMRMGGDEDLRRASHDSHRPRNSFSIETSERAVRKSIDRVRSIAKSQKRFPPRRQDSHGSTSSYENKSGKHDSDSSIERVTSAGDSHSNNTSIKAEEKSSMKEIPNLLDGLQPAYLAISTPVGWLRDLANFRLNFPALAALRYKDQLQESDMKLTTNPTLVLFGDDDGFVSVRRFRAWAEGLESAAAATAGSGNGEGRFRYVEVARAGHFWRDHEALGILETEVRAFAKTL